MYLVEFLQFSAFVSLFIIANAILAHILNYEDVWGELSKFNQVLFYSFFTFCPGFNILFVLGFVLPFYYNLSEDLFSWIKRKTVLYKNPELSSLELFEKVIKVYGSDGHKMSKALDPNRSLSNTQLYESTFYTFSNSLIPFIREQHARPYVANLLKEYESSFANILAVIKGSENAKFEHRFEILKKYGETLSVFFKQLQTLKDKDFSIEGKIGEMTLTRILDELDKETHIHKNNFSKLTNALQEKGY